MQLCIIFIIFRRYDAKIAFLMCTSFDIRNYWRGWNMLQCSSLLCKRGSSCKGTVIDQFTNASLIVKVSLYTILLCQYKWTSIFSFLLRPYSIQRKKSNIYTWTLLVLPRKLKLLFSNKTLFLIYILINANLRELFSIHMPT